MLDDTSAFPSYPRTIRPAADPAGLCFRALSEYASKSLPRSFAQLPRTRAVRDPVRCSPTNPTQRTRKPMIHEDERNRT